MENDNNDLTLDSSVFDAMKNSLLKKEKETLSNLESEEGSLQYELKRISERLLVKQKAIALSKSKVSDLESLTLESVLEKGKIQPVVDSTELVSEMKESV